MKDLLSSRILLATIILPICLWASVNQELLVLFKPDVVQMPAQKVTASLGEIMAPQDVIHCLQEIGVEEIIKVVPNFNRADTMRITEDGIIARLPDFSQLFLIKLTPEADPDSAIFKLTNLNEVINAEKNQIIFPLVTQPNDPQFYQQWNLSDPSGQLGINVMKAWDLSKGSNTIKIGIIDSGVDSLHIDLNGRVYGVRPSGWPDANTMHGTHVGGIAGAVTNNNLDIAGVDWKARIYSPVCINYTWHALETAIQGVYNAVTEGCRVINCSWAFSDFSPDLYSALIWAYQNNVLPVVANAATYNPRTYPNSMGSWLCVVAGTKKGDPTNWNPPCSYLLQKPYVDVAAPGGDGQYETNWILSTRYYNYSFPYGGVIFMAGNSMAAPHVTGLAGLLLGANPGLKNYELEWIMKLSANDVHPPTGIDDYTGYGIIDAYDAVHHVILPYEFLRGDVPLDVYDPVYRNFTSEILPYGEPAGYYKCKMVVADIWLTVSGEYVEIPYAFLSLEGFSSDEPNDGRYWMRRNIIGNDVRLTTCFYYLYARWGGFPPHWISVNKWVPVDPYIIPMRYTVVARKQISPPTNLDAAAAPNTNSIKLTWSDNSNNELKFIIERRIVPGPFEVYDSVGQNITQYIDNNTMPGATYGYQVYAKAQEFRSGYSNADYATAGLGAPGELFINPVVYDGVQLYWTDNSAVEDGFKIERKVGTESYVEIGTTTNPYYWDGNIFNQQVHYRVRAFKGSYDSDTSNSVVIPPAPGIFTDSLKAIGNHVHNAGYFNCRSLRRANDGTCHLVLVHHGRIWYTKSTNNGTTWQLAIPLTEQNPSTPSLAINSYNHPCFVWDETNAQGNHMLTYAYQDISGNIHKFALLTKPNRLYPSIAISPSDLVYIAYVEDSTYSAGKVKRVEFNYDNPVASNPVVYNTAGPQGISITTDPLGNPHLVWIHRYMGHSIKYGCPDGSIETVGGGDAPDIIASSVNNVRVVWASSGEIYYRERTNSGWGNSIIVTQDPAVGNTVYFPRITHNNAVLFKGAFTPEPGNIFGVQPSVFSTLATLLTANTRYYDAVPLPGGTTPTVLLATQRNTSVTGLYKIAFLIKPIPLRLPRDIIYSLPPVPPVEFTAYNNSRRLLRGGDGVLHLAFTSGDNIYHTFLQDTSWAIPVLVGTGKYPALALGPDGRLYCTWAYHGYQKFGGEMYYVEYLMMSAYNGTNWSEPQILFHTYGTLLWGVGAPSMVIYDTMAYVTFKSYHGPHPHPVPGFPVPHIVVDEGPALIYGTFSLNNPVFQWIYADTIIKHLITVDTLVYQDSLVPLLISPSITVDEDTVVHILWEGDSTQMRYYTIVDTMITTQLFDEGVDFPFIGMNGDQIQVFYTARDSIRYRYGWTGTTNLSETQTVASCESPISSGQYLTWTKRENGLSHLYYGAIPASGTINPIEINYSTDLISYPQILFNPKPPSIDLVWTEYSEIDSMGYIYYLNLPLTEVAPKYAFDMGTETPVPILVQRDGFITYGTEDYKTIDYDSTELIYHLTLHSPHTKYKIRWVWYHEEGNKIHLQFNIDDIFHHNNIING
ncbi:MAG: S8 family serine peptidase [candidate division WOR-3 bacterium]